MNSHFKIIKLKDTLETRNSFIACFEDINTKILKARLDEYFSYTQQFHYGLISDDKTIGFLFSTNINEIFYNRNTQGLYITDFIVNPCFRMRGVGSFLFQFYIDKYREFEIFADSHSFIFKKMLSNKKS